MIQSTQIPSLTLATNTSDITFNNDDIRTGGATCKGWLQHTEGTGVYTILGGGLFEISFHANVTSATIGNIAIALKENGIVDESTTAISPISVANDFSNISFKKRIKVCPRVATTITIGSVASSLTGSGTPVVNQIPIISNANLIINKINND